MCRVPTAESQCQTASDQNQKILGEEPGMKEGRTGCQAPEELGKPGVLGLGQRGEVGGHLHKIVHHSGPAFN